VALSSESYGFSQKLLRLKEDISLLRKKEKKDNYFVEKLALGFRRTLSNCLGTIRHG